MHRTGGRPEPYSIGFLGDLHDLEGGRAPLKQDRAVSAAGLPVGNARPLLFFRESGTFFGPAAVVAFAELDAPVSRPV